MPTPSGSSPGSRPSGQHDRPARHRPARPAAPRRRHVEDPQHAAATRAAAAISDVLPATPEVPLRRGGPRTGSMRLSETLPPLPPGPGPLARTYREAQTELDSANDVLKVIGASEPPRNGPGARSARPAPRWTCSTARSTTSIRATSIPTATSPRKGSCPATPSLACRSPRSSPPNEHKNGQGDYVSVHVPRHQRIRPRRVHLPRRRPLRGQPGQPPGPRRRHRRQHH